jgi:hypothetical protein
MCSSFANKMKATLLALLLVPLVAVADEVRSLAKSPDGKFELLLQASAPDDYGWVVIKNASTGKIIESETSQGYSYFPTDDVHAEWRDDSSAFAVSVQGTKTTRYTDVYFKDEDRWEKMDLPPFIDNILGRQGVTDPGPNVSESFGGFVDNSRFSLICDVEPDWQQKEAAGRITQWKPSQQTEWQVVLEYSRRTSPSCRIVSIEPFTANDSEQAGTGQPATRPESKSEDGDKPQPEAEGRSR